MQERFAERVALTWSVADDALEALVPTLLLQPLLENAFKHGVERSRDPVKIQSTAEKLRDELQVTISNSESTLSTAPSSGIGLRNCRERLQRHLRRARQSRLTVQGSGVTARLTLPCTGP